MSAKAPSEGTKVTAGKNAPVTSEGPGVVAQDSLASESQAFRDANDAAPQQTSREDLKTASRPHEGGVHQRSTTSSTRQQGPSGDGNGAPAPSYIQSQALKDPSGPHGRNIKEDPNLGTEGKARSATGTAGTGTADDPARAAEDQFVRANTANAGSAGGREKGIDNEQPFGALGSDAQA
ncbi:hypothetical protein GGR52DRAFT_563481 [Hypoxylon sp. FL1284]|nr:hypothetical protein GGR52DRAFT_563481 [Hypoxylon sp. FL1284]